MANSTKVQPSELDNWLNKYENDPDAAELISDYRQIKKRTAELEPSRADLPFLRAARNELLHQRNLLEKSCQA